MIEPLRRTYVASIECEFEYVHAAFPRSAICVKTMHDKL